MDRDRIWQGVRMRRTFVAAEPDGPVRQTTLPASWDEGAAAALAALVPGRRPCDLATGSEAWIVPLCARAHGLEPGLGRAWRALLLRRQGAPSAETRSGAAAADGPGFVLNLSGFLSAAGQLDLSALSAAIGDAVAALVLLAPEGGRLRLGVSDFACVLAAGGVAYDSPEAVGIATSMAAFLRFSADLALARMPGEPTVPGYEPAIPADCAWSALNGAVRAARAACTHGPLRACTAIMPPGPADALLGVETAGVAPAFSAVDPAMVLRRSARLWLAARGIGLEHALVRAQLGETVFPEAGIAAHARVHAAFAAYVQAMPPCPVAWPRAAGGRREALPARHRGYTQKAQLAGHRIYVRTGEYDDGRLGEVAIALGRENSFSRGLIEAFGHAVSIGLQHGVPLAAYAEQFVNTRFGPDGAVEGDPSVARAGSVLDYAFRHLAAAYLGDAFPLPAAPAPANQDHPLDTLPLLPLDLPTTAQPEAARRDKR